MDHVSLPVFFLSLPLLPDLEGFCLAARSHKLSEEVQQAVIDFYQSSDVSRETPGIKNVVVVPKARSSKSVEK